MFLNNRYMDPASGVFLSVDPMVAKTGTAYLYGGGNPATLSDPNGLCAGNNGRQGGDDGKGACGGPADQPVSSGAKRWLSDLHDIYDVVPYLFWHDYLSQVDWYTSMAPNDPDRDQKLAGALYVVQSFQKQRAATGDHQLVDWSTNTDYLMAYLVANEALGNHVLSSGGFGRSRSADVGGGAAMPTGSGGNTVYIGSIDGVPSYVGITSNFAARSSAWRGTYELEPIVTDLERYQARAIEQVIIEANPGFRNQIASIAESRPWYRTAIEWGKAKMAGMGLPEEFLPPEDR